MNNYFINPHIIEIALAVVAAVIAGLILHNFFGIGKAKNSDFKSEQTNTNNQNQTVILHTHSSTSDSLSHELSSSKIGTFKVETKILFIDDLDLRRKIKNLKDAGWKKVSQIKDAPNIDISEIREADIIFIDYKGIGKMQPNEEGLSILKALKNRYSNNKYLILYSAHNVPVEAFNLGANHYLSKNSTIYELEQKIIEGINKIKK